MTRVEIGAKADLEPGERTVVETDKGSIGVFNVDGEYYAVRNNCPHRGGPVCEGKVERALVSDWPGVGERVKRAYDDKPAITCPWHGWDFYLDSGEHVGLDSIKVPTYDTIVEDGTIYVDI